MKGNHTFDLGNTINVLTGRSIRSDTDSSEAVPDGVVKAGVKTDFGKIVPANANMLKVNQTRGLLFTLHRLVGLSFAVSPLHFAFAVGVCIRISIVGVARSFASFAVFPISFALFIK